jgi:guanylate kinase
MIVILTGFTGVGKTEIRSSLLERNPNMRQLVTTTTRSPRPGEINGRDYHFITEDQFAQGVTDGAFVETAQYFSTDRQTGKVIGRHYGTTKKELEHVWEGHTLVTTMEISGAATFGDQVKAAYDEDKAKAILDRTIVLYIEADSEAVLKARFIARGGTEREFEARIAQDKAMQEQYGDRFKHRVSNLNDRLAYAIGDVEELIKTAAQV